jgi:hypothetical protein
MTRRILMYKMRVWMKLHCTDREELIYRDVAVPVVPRMISGDREDRCDFYLTGLFSEPLFTRGLDIKHYVKGQPDEPLYEPCYDVGLEIWHVRVSDHQFQKSWVVAMEGPYRDWTVANRARVVATDIIDAATSNSATHADKQAAPRRSRKKRSDAIV